MKILKFRAWHKERSEMLFGTAGRDGGLVFVRPADMYADEREEIGYRSPDIEIMQFVGVKDKSGREIYEGDVVIDDRGLEKNGSAPTEFEVIYDSGRASFEPIGKIPISSIKVLRTKFQKPN